MKKRNYISHTLLSVLLLSVTVFAQGVTGVVQRMRDFWSGIFKLFGVDLATKAGQAGLLKFLLFIIVAVAIYEVMTRLLSQRPLFAGIIGSVLSLATVLLVPSEILLAVFSSASTIVILLLMIVILAPPTVFTWILFKKRNPGINAGLAIGWFFLWIVFSNTITAIAGADRSGWWSISSFFMWAVILALAVAAITKWGGSAVSTAGSNRWARKFKDWATDQLTSETATVEAELASNITALAAAGTWTNAQWKQWSNKVEAELNKAHALVRVERGKPALAGNRALQAEMKELMDSVTSTAGGVHVGFNYPAAPRGCLIPWLQYLDTNWDAAAGAMSIDGTNALNTPAGKNAEAKRLTAALQSFDKFLKYLNREIIKATK